jgi:hypothetical protein
VRGSPERSWRDDVNDPLLRYDQLQGMARA